MFTIGGLSPQLLHSLLLTVSPFSLQSPISLSGAAAQVGDGGADVCCHQPHSSASRYHQKAAGTSRSGSGNGVAVDALARPHPSAPQPRRRCRRLIGRRLRRPHSGAAALTVAAAYANDGGDAAAAGIWFVLQTTPHHTLLESLTCMSLCKLFLTSIPLRKYTHTYMS